MENVTFTVPSISCGHCTSTIERVVGELDGVRSVSADVGTKRVAVAFEPPATRDVIAAVMAEWDFPPEP